MLTELETQIMNFDTAAMHPDIGRRWDAPGKAYYRRTAEVRDRILNRIARNIGTRHTLFLTTNTSQGLLAICLAASRARMSPLRLLNRPYPQYETLLGYPGTLAANQAISLCTHICPLTGEVFDLRSCVESLLIVDAAQSLGTVFQQELVDTAPVFIGPLHKHMNLVPGLGLVAVDIEGVDAVFAAALRTVLEVMEHGTMNLGLLEECDQRLDERQGHLSLNRVRIHVGELLRSTARRLGMRLLTPSGTQAHIASFTTIDGCPVDALLDPERVGARVFTRNNIFRISLNSDVHGVRSPEEYEEFVAATLSRAAR